jgi:hypothetical protein
MVVRDRVYYNCFITKKFVSLDKPASLVAEPPGTAHVALHAITEQLMVLLWPQGVIGVYSFRDEAIRAKVLCAELERPAGADWAHEAALAFAVHRNFAVILLPACCVIYHLRVGRLWQVLPLGASRANGPRRFWLDRTADTGGALGLWSDREVLRFVNPPAHEEQALLAQGRPGEAPHLRVKGLMEAAHLCRAYGPSMQQTLARRAVDVAHNFKERGLRGADYGRFLRLDLPVYLRVAMHAGEILPDEPFERLGDDVREALGKLDALREELRAIHANPIIQSEKSEQREQIVDLARKLREGYAPLSLPLPRVLQPLS